MALLSPAAPTVTAPKRLPPMVSGRQPLIGHLRELTANPAKLLLRGYHEHGSCFRIALPANKSAVVMLGPDLSAQFFNDPAMSSAEAYPMFERLFAPGFFSLGDDTTYRQQKKVMRPLFQGNALASYVDVMNNETTKFVEKLGPTGAFELTDEFGPLVMEIAARSMLGENFAQEMPGRDFFHVFREFSLGMNNKPLALRLISRADWKSLRARDLLKSLIGAMFDRRRANPDTDTPDFLHILSTATYDDGTPVTRDTAINMVNVIVWAGHETTVGALAWLLSDLLQHPEALERARAEAATAIAVHGKLDWDAARSLRFLDACMFESERLHPIPPMLARAVTTDVDVDGYTVPAGTFVFASPMVTHQLPEAVPEPNIFDPDRFLGPDTTANRKALIGFGGGKHRCLGVGFARLEMKIVVARLITELDMTLVHGAPAPRIGAVTQWPESPCEVRYQQRSRQEFAATYTRQDAPPGSPAQCPFS